MKSRKEYVLIGLSIAVWLILLCTQWLFLRDAYALTAGKQLGEIAQELNLILNPVEGENAPNDFLVQYADLFADTIHSYSILDEIEPAAIPFDFSELNSERDRLLNQVHQQFGSSVRFAIVLEEWGPIDDDNNYVPYQRLEPSIKNSLLGSLSELQGAVSYGSFSSTEKNIFFFAKLYFVYDNIWPKTLQQITGQVILAIISFLLLTGLLVWSMTRLFRLQKEKQQQIEFVDNIQHSFQTPLTTIKVASASQMKYLAENNLTEARKMGSYVHAQTARLQQIIDQLNQNATPQLKEVLNKKEVALSRLIQHCIQDMTIKYNNRTVNITYDSDPINITFNGDPFYLKTAFLNVLDNAFHYNEEDENLQIFISARSLLDSIKIEITDNGQGVNRDVVKNLGNKYYRPESSSHLSGLGLGIYQSRQIVKAHGGTLNIISDTTAGFSVHIKLPADDET